MKKIDDIIKEAKFASVSQPEFSYDEDIPKSPEDLCKNSREEKIMKYYNGSITKEEHEEFKKENHEIAFVKVYDLIFDIMDSNSMEFLSEVKQSEMDEIADLYLGLSDNSKYKEAFKKLIFILYCKKNKELKFKDIALDLYDECEWAKKYINEKKEYWELFESKIKENKNYNMCYGILNLNKEIGINENNSEVSTKIKINLNEEDWILKKFGGDEIGKATSMEDKK